MRSVLLAAGLCRVFIRNFRLCYSSLFCSRIELGIRVFVVAATQITIDGLPPVRAPNRWFDIWLFSLSPFFLRAFWPFANRKRPSADNTTVCFFVARFIMFDFLSLSLFFLIWFLQQRRQRYNSRTCEIASRSQTLQKHVSFILHFCIFAHVIFPELIFFIRRRKI